VQSGELVTGLKFRLANFDDRTFVGKSENGRQLFSLGFTASIGATGRLNPTSTVSTWVTPATTSPQYARFAKTFPAAANSPYIAFVSPDRDQFFRQYFFGFRLTSQCADMTDHSPSITAPAMACLTFGQNELVTGGRLHGVVMRAEAFYPLPFGSRNPATNVLSGIYLFGTVQMYLKRRQNIDPFVLQPKPSTVNAYDPNVAQVTVPSNREIYRIGVGIDLVSLITAMTHQASNTQAQSSITQIKVQPLKLRAVLCSQRNSARVDTSATEAKSVRRVSCLRTSSSAVMEPGMSSATATPMW
jgi:hypothetical protein